MDDLLGLVVLIVFYIVAAANRKNKAKKGRTERRRQAKPAASDPWDEIRKNLSYAMDSLEQAKEAPKSIHKKPLEHDESCEAQSIHLHEVTQTQMVHALEGEDPCHAGGVELKAETMQAVGMDEDKQKTELAQELLRGVIMSEILTRPCDRKVGMRMKRRA